MVLVIIFLGALLLFVIQPMAAKELLPKFGGTPSTWGVTLLFFQLELLAGYFWAHCLIRIVPKSWRSNLQLLFIILACATIALPSQNIESLTNWQTLNPIDVLISLWRRWGIVTFLLCSTSPFIQGIVEGSFKGKLVYRFYAISNAGSLLGLLAYPFLLEPFFELETIKTV